MFVKNIQSKSILSKSKVSDYSLNPYIGCAHGCTYCYAKYMKRFTGHQEEWGTFVDIKTNAVQLLRYELQRKKLGKVWLSGTCDPYQPVEARSKLTRGCLALLVKQKWPITIQTKSPLILRDIDLLTRSQGVEVVITITTADDSIREIFEPNAPSVNERIHAVSALHDEGIPASVMIAPLLPQSDNLIPLLQDKTRLIIIDKMNYINRNRSYLGYQLSDVCPICHERIETHNVHIHDTHDELLTRDRNFSIF